MSQSKRRLQAALFDLDGTLLDTAPDIATAMNALLREQSRPELAFGSIRPHVSHGSVAVVKAGFADVSEVEFERLRLRFLDLYRESVAVATRLFPGFEATLESLERARIPWGVVTNKPGWLTDPLLDALDLSRRAGCVISGDSMPERKPHPRPLLVAAGLLNVAAEHCVYVGDALRDIKAARAAGMLALGASFGYIGPDDQPETWCADGWLSAPEELLNWFESDLEIPRAAALERR
jgi:N-acetyl-D-muramate 6-phosphate phosphatase